MTIGLFGGAFDPIHWGHLRVAQSLIEADIVQTIRFIPTRVGHFGKRFIATPQQRLEMLQAALFAQSRIQVETCELDRTGPSYTLETLKALALPDAYWIMGADALPSLPAFKGWPEPLQWAKWIIVTRPGFDIRQEDLWAAFKQEDDYQIFVPPQRWDIQSTQIRQRIAQNLPLEAYLPQAVIDYIQTHGLYRHA